GCYGITLGSNGGKSLTVVIESLDRVLLRHLPEFWLSIDRGNYDCHVRRLSATREDEPSRVLRAASIRHGRHAHDGRLERTGHGLPRPGNSVDSDLCHGRISAHGLEVQRIGAQI